jgi:hypothetical protein
MILSNKTYFGLPYECYTHYYIVRGAHEIMTEGYLTKLSRRAVAEAVRSTKERTHAPRKH